LAETPIIPSAGPPGYEDIQLRLDDNDDTPDLGPSQVASGN
jgi:hypothetical protein